MSQHSRPESVLVVIHTPERECLLLERTNPRGFWQSVTGTLHWNETPAETAAREVREEIGMEPVGLVDTGICKSFPILPEWRERYAPNINENVEYLWYMEVAAVCEINLNEVEHAAFCWMELEEAIGTVASWTNREALVRLRGS